MIFDEENFEDDFRIENFEMIFDDDDFDDDFEVVQKTGMFCLRIFLLYWGGSPFIYTITSSKHINIPDETLTT